MFEPHPACAKCATNVIFVADRPGVGRAVDTAYECRRGDSDRHRRGAAGHAVPRRDAGGAARASGRSASPADGARLPRGGFRRRPDRPGRQGRPRHDRPDHARRRSRSGSSQACSGAASLEVVSRSYCSTCARPRASRRRRTACAERSTTRGDARRVGRGAARLRRSRRPGLRGADGRHRAHRDDDRERDRRARRRHRPRSRAARRAGAARGGRRCSAARAPPQPSSGGAPRAPRRAPARARLHARRRERGAGLLLRRRPRRPHRPLQRHDGAGHRRH